MPPLWPAIGQPSAREPVTGGGGWQSQPARALRVDPLVFAAVLFTACAQSALPAALMCRLAGIPLRLAHSPENPYGLLTHWVRDTEVCATGMRHEVMRQLDLVRSVGLHAADERMQFRYHAADVLSMRRKFVQAGGDLLRPYVVVHPGANAAARRYGFNPEAAKLRLEAAGFPVHRAPAADRMDSRLRFTCLFWNEDPLYERIALMLQRQLFDIGIDMVLEPLSAIQLEERLASGSFDAFLYQFNSGRGFDWTYAFWHSPEAGVRSMQMSGYTGVDGALERLRAARNDASIW